MEEQLITITVRTCGEKCQLSDEEIRQWYACAMRNALDPACGTPEISVDLKRTEIA